MSLIVLLFESSPKIVLEAVSLNYPNAFEAILNNFVTRFKLLEASLSNFVGLSLY